MLNKGGCEMGDTCLSVGNICDGRLGICSKVV